MKKKIVLRGLMGVPIGITIGYLITIITSLIWAHGYYSPCPPELIKAMGNTINAVILQTFFCALLGAGFSAGSVIWEMENWSIVKQTGLYFLLMAVIMMPIAYFARWMEHTLTGFLGYFGIFILIFVIIWIILFIIGRYNVKRMNANLNNIV